MITDKGKVLDSAMVGEHASLSGMAIIRENAVLEGTAVAEGHAIIEGNALVTGTAYVRGYVGGDVVITAGDFPEDAEIRSNRDFIAINTEKYYRMSDCESPLPETEITIYRTKDNQPRITMCSHPGQSLEEFEKFLVERHYNRGFWGGEELLATVQSAYKMVCESCARQNILKDEKDQKTSLSGVKDIAARQKAEHKASENNNKQRSR